MRDKLIGELADEMREAENYFLETGDDSKKFDVQYKVEGHNFTDEEFKEWCEICTSMGV